ncbi:GIY-YIG nuclease family protein [Streptomyces mirabilis]|uniref:GIY-YIG nuclease family protein n=1 Tax=Streptomyces mirabilis TaxID=68239 RepID=UPI00225854DC|nr:GIY-YIG nuclease family protein [Streptomyces mirabilis]MCX4429455.1 GIY-YIG nuclease family protein [Streptomyces mirabilis]
MTKSPTTLAQESESPEGRIGGRTFQALPPRPDAQPWDVVQFSERFPSPRRGPASRKPSHVYVIGMEGSAFVKIGFTTTDPRKRLSSLQTGQPSALRLLWHCDGGATLERDLHRRFHAHHVRGEWFNLAPLGDPVEVVRAAVSDLTAGTP